MIGNLLIVDDELDILEGLSELFKVELPEITVFAVNNARKALALLDSIHFDVVLTDINMPKMDGISMFKKIRESWPQCRVIFLTGYRDFDHLYEINQFKDVMYLLKSETNENLLNTVKSSFKSITKMMSDDKELVLDDKIKDVQQKYLSTEMARRISQNWEIEIDFLEEYTKVRNLFPKEPLFTFFFQFDTVDWVLNSRENIKKHLRENCQKFFPSSMNVSIQWVSHYQGLLLIQLPGFDLSKKEFIHSQYIKAAGATMYLQEKLLMAYKESFSFLTSTDLVYFTELPKRFKKLLSFSYLILNNRKQTIFKLEDVSSDKDSVDQGSYNFQEILSELKISIDTRDNLKFEGLVGKILFFILSTENIKEIQTLYHGSMSILYSTLIKFNAIKGDDNLIFQPYETNQQAEKSILEFSYMISTLFENKGESDRLSEISNQVKKYVKNNLNSDLSLIRLADICFLNPAYLSRVFKQFTGEKISDYISRKRIELSKEQLKNSQIKIKDIGINVGYVTPHSFTRFFKKNVGMTPKEYREIHGVSYE